MDIIDRLLFDLDELQNLLGTELSKRLRDLTALASSEPLQRPAPQIRAWPKDTDKYLYCCAVASSPPFGSTIASSPSGPAQTVTTEAGNITPYPAALGMSLRNVSYHHETHVFSVLKQFREKHGQYHYNSG